MLIAVSVPRRRGGRRRILLAGAAVVVATFKVAADDLDRGRHLPFEGVGLLPELHEEVATSVQGLGVVPQRLLQGIRLVVPKIQAPPSVPVSQVVATAAAAIVVGVQVSHLPPLHILASARRQGRQEAHVKGRKDSLGVG